MGHGTPHEANSVYAAFEQLCHSQGRRDLFVGTVEGCPALEDVLPALRRTGCGSVLLAPMMLVAGDHACNDMAGDGRIAGKACLPHRDLKYPAVCRAWESWRISGKFICATFGMQSRFAEEVAKWKRLVLRCQRWLGDPQLLTFRAAGVIAACPVIAAPQTKGKIGRLCKLPGRRFRWRAKKLCRSPFDDAGSAAAAAKPSGAGKPGSLFPASGQSVAMLNLGDISIYSTFSYLAELVEQAYFPTEWIPAYPVLRRGCKTENQPDGDESTRYRLSPPGTGICSRRWIGRARRY